MYSTASRTLLIFSASSSGISIPNSSSKAITSSTMSRESAPRSSVKLASRVTSSSSTPSCSTMMLLTFSATAIAFPPHSMVVGPGRARARPAVLTQRRFASPWERSDVQPPRHVQGMPGDVPRLLAGEEEDGRGDVVHGAQALEGDGAGEGLLGGLGERLGHRGLDVARSHHVGRDVAAAQLAGQRLGEADQPRLGGRVVRLAGVAHHAHHRGDVDDPPPPALHHPPDHLFAEREGAGQVGAQHPLPVVEGHASEQVVGGDAGVVDQDVDLPEVGWQALQPLAEGLGLGDVERQRPGAAPAGVDVGGERLELLLVARRHHHPRPLEGQELGDGLADPLGGAGHQGGLVVQLEHQPSSSARSCRRWSGSEIAVVRADWTIRRVSPESTLPGPTSTKAWTPKPASTRSTDSTQRTGLSICRTSASRAASPVVTGAASTLVTTGTRGSLKGVAASRGVIPSRAGRMSGEWKGAETASRVALRAPRSFANATARSTATLSPAITVWAGPL